LLTGEAQEVAAKLRLHVKGVARLAIAPAGKTTTVRLDSAWPHPSFFGRALPDTRPPGAAPFPATWSVSHLANSTSARLESGSKPEDRADGGPGPDAFGVAFLDPVNIYSQSERSVKYGILFIGLTFAAFLLYEALAGLLLHPLQYALVGLALALFYLLLLSLAEQIGFAPAYLAAALAAVALITYYLAPVLGNWRRALGAGAGLGVLFAALYGLLRSEDQALLLGSVLVFGLLALVMALTRRIDWYGLRGGAPASR
jgi:inner membrane protein